MIYDDIDNFWIEFMKQAFAQDEGGPVKIFRGITNRKYQLIPAIGRKTKAGTLGDITSLEYDSLEEFKRLTRPELNHPPQSDFEWLFLAQHYGLPTRLLDWSTNPLVALYFAVERHDEIDGAVYLLRHTTTDQYELFNYQTADYTERYKKEPSSVFALQPEQKTVIFIRPPYSDNRHLNQKAIFSCHADPFSHLDINGIKKLEFSGKLKPKLRERLKALGVSSSFIYPGLSGIASEIKSFYYSPIVDGRLIRSTGTVKISI